MAWEGRTVARSFVRTINGRAMWTYLEAQPVEARRSLPQAETSSGSDSGNSGLLYGLIGGVIVLGAGLFFRGRRAG